VDVYPDKRGRTTRVDDRLPLEYVPAESIRTSPDAAAFMADCNPEPGGTTIVAAFNWHDPKTARHVPRRKDQHRNIH